MGISHGRVLNSREEIDQLLSTSSSSSSSSTTTSSIGDETNASKLAATLNRAVLGLYSDFVSEDGTKVDYASLKKSSAFAELLQSTLLLRKVDLTLLSREEKLAFFINIYNVMIIHGAVVFGFGTSVMERTASFSKFFYNIGSFLLTPNDVEHGILRGNRRQPYGLLPKFWIGDTRAALSIQDVDPRIHFALVCGAKSCPPIRIYTPENLEIGLQKASQSYCEAHTHINSKNHEVVLSKLFDWYKGDFGGKDETVLNWICPHLSEEKRKDLEDLLRSGDWKIRFAPYNWDPNDAATSSSSTPPSS